MRKLLLRGFGLLIISASFLQSAESPRALAGTWVGKATGPQGGPPTGELTIRFEREGSGIKGTAVVKGSGTLQYSGEVSDIALKKGVFSAVAVFKLGEVPLEVRITGPMKGRTIAGTFVVFNAKREKMGDGTFSVTKRQ